MSRAGKIKGFFKKAGRRRLRVWSALPAFMALCVFLAHGFVHLGIRPSGKTAPCCAHSCAASRFHESEGSSTEATPGFFVQTEKDFSFHCPLCLLLKGGEIKMPDAPFGAAALAEIAAHFNQYDQPIRAAEPPSCSAPRAPPSLSG